MVEHDFFLKDTGLYVNELKNLIQALKDKGLNPWERREIIENEWDFLSYPCMVEEINMERRNPRDFLMPPSDTTYN